jgi:hypothetical protein
MEGAPAAAEHEEEPVCRYCFEGAEEGELLSPCSCAGGQKWVHIACLRRWQRMVLVSQPTHPMYYRDDVRHHECGVCKSKFTCAPPTRHELMQSFTGGEIAALIEEGCIIAAHVVFSDALQREVGVQFGVSIRSSSQTAVPRCVFVDWLHVLPLSVSLPRAAATRRWCDTAAGLRPSLPVCLHVVRVAASRETRASCTSAE